MSSVLSKLTLNMISIFILLFGTFGPDFHSLGQVEEELKSLTEPKGAEAPAAAAAATPDPTSTVQPQNGHGHEEAMDTDAPATAPEPVPPPERELTPQERQQQERSVTVVRIIRGEASIQLYLEFLHGHNHADLQVSCLAPSAGKG